MDPVTQVLAQQNSGSAQGQGFGQFFVAGRQDARQREQLNLASRAEQRMQQRQNMLLPYEQSVMAAQIIAAGQQAEFNRQKQLTMVQQNTALPEILALESHFMKSPQGYKDADGLAALENLQRRFPQAFAEGAPGYSLRLQQKATVMYDIEKQRLQELSRSLVDSGMEPEEATIKSGLVNATFVNPSINSRYAPANVQKELNALNDAYQRKDNNAITALRKKLGLDQLSPISKQQFEAEIEALDRNVKLATRPDEYLAARKQIIERYFGMAQREAGEQANSTAPPPQPKAGTGTITNGNRKFEYDLSTGKLKEVK